MNSIEPPLNVDILNEGSLDIIEFVDLNKVFGFLNYTCESRIQLYCD